MFEPSSLLITALVFILAGMVKGVIGLGLPSITLALLTLAFDLPTAMAVLILPSFITNVWQMFDGGNAKVVLKRVWPFIVAAGLTVWIGAMALTRVDSALLSTLLGLLLIVYAVLGITGYKMSMPKSSEGWCGPATGILNGLLTGMTGSFVVPGVMYLQSLNMSRNDLVQAMGMLFTTSTVALAVALRNNGLFNTDLGVLSALSIAPALVGMVVGRAIRQRLSDKLFKQMFYGALLCLGIYILIASYTGA